MVNKEIERKVQEKVKEANQMIFEAMINGLASQEIQMRGEMVTSVMAQITNLEKERKAVENDDIIVYLEGDKSTSMSKERHEKLTRFSNEIKIRVEALDEAHDEGTDEAWKKIRKFSKRID